MPDQPLKDFGVAVRSTRQSGGKAGYYPKQSLSKREPAVGEFVPFEKEQGRGLVSQLAHIPYITETAPEVRSAARAVAERAKAQIPVQEAQLKAGTHVNLLGALLDPVYRAFGRKGPTPTPAEITADVVPAAAEYANLTDIAMSRARIPRTVAGLLAARGVGRAAEAKTLPEMLQAGVETGIGAFGLRRAKVPTAVTEPRVPVTEPVVTPAAVSRFAPERPPSPFEEYLRRARTATQEAPKPEAQAAPVAKPPIESPFEVVPEVPAPQERLGIGRATELEAQLQERLAEVPTARARIVPPPDLPPEDAQAILDEIVRVTRQQPRFELPPQTPRPPVERGPRPLQGRLFPAPARRAPVARLKPAAAPPAPEPSPLEEVLAQPEPAPARPIPERVPAIRPTADREMAVLRGEEAAPPVREPAQVVEDSELARMLRPEREPEIPMPVERPISEGAARAEAAAGRALTADELAEGNRLRAQYDQAKAAYGSAARGTPEKGNLLKAYQEAGRVLRDYGTRLAGEEGFATLPFMYHAGSMALGALGGREYARRYEPEHELAYTLLGGAAGLALPSAVKSPAGYYLANLLSSPLTQMRNIAGNIGRAGLDIATTGVGETGLVGGGFRRGETAALLRGQRAGMQRGAGYALEDLLRGPAQRTARLKAQAAAQGRSTTPFDIPPRELPGGGMNPLNYPARTLNAMDSFFREVSTGGRTAQLGFNPHGMSPTEIIENINTHGAKSVFQEDPGKIARAVIDAKKNWGPAGQLLEAVIPFVRTRANLLRQGTIDFSPLGFLTKTARAKTFAGAEARAKALVGSAIMAYPAYLASTGQISGKGPTDKIERAQLLERGWRPYSVLLGGKWYSYQAAQPLSSMLSIVADGMDAYRESKSDEDLATMVARIGQRVGNAALSQSYFDSVGQLQEAMQSADPTRFLDHLKKMAQNLVPGSAFMRTITSAHDPIIRNPDSMDEWVKALMPTVSQEVPAKTDRWGRPLERPGTELERLLSPVVGSPEAADPVVDELARLGYRIGKQSGQLTLHPGTRRSQKLELGSREKAYLSDFRGSAKYEALQRLFQTPGYNRASDQRRYRRIAQIMQRTETRSSQQLRREFAGR